MANATPVSVGRVNASGSEDALFLKVFAGEVLTSFERASKTAGADMERSISSGKSATFPVMGRVAAAYHTAGAEINGSDVNHNEKVITINDLLISSVFLSNIEEVKARGGIIITITDKENDPLSSLSDFVLITPKTHKYIFPINSSIILQILAYELAVCRDCEIDQPRNLAKSVTVE